MQFTFRRDEEGRERIYVGDVCVFMMDPSRPPGERGELMGKVDGVDDDAINDAIERADEAGFWDTAIGGADIWIYGPVKHEVTVDVHVSDNSVPSAITEDQS